jgi:hypothetical protein
LQLAYDPGNKVFGWRLFPNEAGLKSAGPFVSGEANPVKAASQICTVVASHGATTR